MFHQIFNAYLKIINKINEVGFYSALSLALFKLSLVVSNFESRSKNQPKNQLYDFINNSALIINEGLKNRQKNSEAPIQENLLLPSLYNHNYEFSWIVPAFSKGSGGHKNLFRFIKILESFGYKCTIYFVSDTQVSLKPSQIKSQIIEYFENVEAEVIIFDPIGESIRSNILVSTNWLSAYAACKFEADLKVYFVQDYESFFFSHGSYYYLAQLTYQFGFYHITLGKWLATYLRDQHKVKADYFDLVVDKSIYYPRSIIKNQKILNLSQESGFKVCFYGRSITPRRCYEIIIMALSIFAAKVDDVTIISYGQDGLSFLPFKHVNLGILSVDELSELYTICDVCISPSATNLSLVAHETMACGCILMDLNVENTVKTLIHLQNSYLVEADPLSMAEGLLYLYNDPELVEQLKAKSLSYISQLKDWDFQVKTFVEHISSSFSKK
jgi:O-antigen biosynthesis protein